MKSSIFLIIAFITLTSCSKKTNQKELNPWLKSKALCEVGNQKQLLFDDYVVEDIRDTKRKINKPIKYSGNPIIVTDRPWESFAIPNDSASLPVMPNTVLYDKEEKIFKMWGTIFRYVFYDSAKNSGYTYWAVYLTSKDGIHWQKPNLDIVEFNGSKNNNIIMQGKWWAPVGTVIKEMSEPDSQKRYKMLYTDVYGMDVFKKMSFDELKKNYKKLLDEYYQNGKVQSVVCVAYSPDGIHWTPSKDNPVMYTESDCMNTVFWDKNINKYVWFMRPNVYAGPWKRRIARTESKDFIHWDFPRTVLVPDELDPTRFYGMPVFYDDGVYFGLLQIYYDKSAKIEIQLAYSRNSFDWKRLPTREVFIGNGPKGSFDEGMIFTAPPVKVGNELWFYYSGATSSHNETGGIRAVGLAKIKADRYIAQENVDGKEGKVLTRPFVLKGNKININALTKNGSVQTELLTFEGEKIKGFEKENSIPFVGDSLNATVKWKGKEDISELKGKIIRIKFYLNNASIYSFKID